MHKPNAPACQRCRQDVGEGPAVTLELGEAPAGAEGDPPGAVVGGVDGVGVAAREGVAGGGEGVAVGEASTDARLTVEPGVIRAPVGPP